MKCFSVEETKEIAEVINEEMKIKSTFHNGTGSYYLDTNQKDFKKIDLCNLYLILKKFNLHMKGYTYRYKKRLSNQVLKKPLITFYLRGL